LNLDAGWDSEARPAFFLQFARRIRYRSAAAGVVPPELRTCT